MDEFKKVIGETGIDPEQEMERIIQILGDRFQVGTPSYAIQALVVENMRLRAQLAAIQHLTTMAGLPW